VLLQERGCQWLDNLFRGPVRSSSLVDGATQLSQGSISLTLRILRSESPRLDHLNQARLTINPQAAATQRRLLTSHPSGPTAIRQPSSPAN